jgi:dephospho-CoA kinase
MRRVTECHVIGVLGGVASGKSAVARALAGPDGVVIDADKLAREVLAAPELQAPLRTAFGAGVFGTDGRLDRDRLAAIVFGSREKRTALEGFTHPLIRDRIRAQLDAARERGVPRIVLDVPLLLEHESQHGLAAECRTLVFVDADAQVRDARAVASRGWQPGEVARREATQMPLERKRARADHVIVNEGSLSDLEAAARRILVER